MHFTYNYIRPCTIIQFHNSTRTHTTGLIFTIIVVIIILALIVLWTASLFKWIRFIIFYKERKLKIAFISCASLTMGSSQ